MKVVLTLSTFSGNERFSRKGGNGRKGRALQSGLVKMTKTKAINGRKTDGSCVQVEFHILIQGKENCAFLLRVHQLTATSCNHTSTRTYKCTCVCKNDTAASKHCRERTDILKQGEQPTPPKFYAPRRATVRSSPTLQLHASNAKLRSRSTEKKPLFAATSNQGAHI